MARFKLRARNKRWQPPPVGELKLNCDASYRAAGVRDRAGHLKPPGASVGCLLRNNRGDFLNGAFGLVEAENSCEAEVQGLYVSMLHLVSYNLRDVTVESDWEPAKHMVDQPGQAKSQRLKGPTGALLRLCHGMRDRYGFSVVFAVRECNKCADRLARIALDTQIPHPVDINEPPQDRDFRRYLQADRPGNPLGRIALVGLIICAAFYGFKILRRVAKSKTRNGDSNEHDSSPVGPVISTLMHDESGNGNELKLDAIHDYAREGDIKNLLKCVESGVSVDTKDSEGRTPLQWAIDRGHIDVHSRKDNEGNTPLHCAALYGREKL